MNGARRLSAACVVVATLLPIACRGVLGIHELPADEDAGNGSEAAADANAPIEGATFCTGSEHALCADFDEDASLSAGWDQMRASSAAWGKDFDVFVSPPGAARGYLNAPPASDGAAEASPYVSLERVFSVTPSHVHWEADVLVDGACRSSYGWVGLVRVGFGPSQSYVVFFGLVADADGSTQQGLTLEVHERNFVTQELGRIPLGQAMPTGAWMHVSLDATFAGTPRVKFTVGSLERDGVLFVAAEVFDAGAPGGVVFGIGPHSVGLEEACQVAYDDVTFDVE